MTFVETLSFCSHFLTLSCKWRTCTASFRGRFGAAAISHTAKFAVRSVKVGNNVPHSSVERSFSGNLEVPEKCFDLAEFGII